MSAVAICGASESVLPASFFFFGSHLSRVPLNIRLFRSSRNLSAVEVLHGEGGDKYTQYFLCALYALIRCAAISFLWIRSISGYTETRRVTFLETGSAHCSYLHSWLQTIFNETTMNWSQTKFKVMIVTARGINQKQERLWLQKI